MRVELHPEARAELRAAAIWSDEQRPELGDELIVEISSMLGKIGEAPASFQIQPGTSSSPRSIRRAVISRCPYVIVFGEGLAVDADTQFPTRMTRAASVLELERNVE